MLLLIPLEKNDTEKVIFWVFIQSKQNVVHCTCYKISEFIHLERVTCAVLYLFLKLMYNNSSLFLYLRK